MTKPKRRVAPKRPIESLWRWPLRLVPKPQESGHGFIARFAQQYRCEPHSLIYAIGATTASASHFPPSDVQRLSIVMGLSPDEARKLFTTRIDSHYSSCRASTIMGKPFFREQLKSAWRRVCPLCLVDAPYDRAIWRVDCITFCVKHRVDLMDHCPKCRRRLHRYTQHVCQCKCGFDFRQACHIPVRKEGLTEVEEAGRLIADLLTGEADYLPKELANIPPMDFCFVMHDLRHRFQRPDHPDFKFDPVDVREGLQLLQSSRKALLGQLIDAVEGTRVAWNQGVLRRMADTNVLLHRAQAGAEIRSLLNDVFRIIRDNQRIRYAAITRSLPKKAA